MKMEKVIDLNNTVYEICIKDPAVKEILSELGFTDILKPGMLTTAGKFMTIPKGAKLKKIDIDTVKKAFTEHGYTLRGI